MSDTNYKDMGKESILCFAGNSLIMCFSLKDIGTTIAKWNNERSWFRNSDERYYINRVSSLLASFNDASFSSPPFLYRFIDILNRTYPSLCSTLKNAVNRKIIKKDSWLNILKTYFSYLNIVYDNYHKVLENRDEETEPKMSDFYIPFTYKYLNKEPCKKTILSTRLKKDVKTIK